MHACAVSLIKAGKAYVDSQSAEEMRANRGTLTEPGKDSPYRNRSIEENLDLFARMRAGEFAEGTHILRARIDMASPNINLRDPAIYRIRHASHHRTGDAWCIYPMYTFAHPIEDAIENITHSVSHWSSRISVRSTTGCWMRSPPRATSRARCRSRSSSPAST